MIKRIHAGIKRAFGLHNPGRNLRIFPDDVFLVSYPKSGNTWTRFLVANLVCPGEAVTFANIDRLIPECEEMSKRKLAQVPRPRVLKSHQYFHPDFPRMVYVVRDPRDVVVSQYHFFRKRRWIEDTHPLERFVDLFVAGGDSGGYGSWGENVASWVATKHNQRCFLLLKYEDMLGNTAEALRRIASLLDLPADEARIARAVERSSATEMRRLESASTADASVTRNARGDIPFVREAKAGGWKSTLSPDSVAKIEARWGDLMRYLGYEMFFPERRTDHDAVNFLAADN